MRAGIVWLCLILQGFAAEPAGKGTTPGEESEERATDAAATEPGDYGQAFAQLIALGLPDATGASYVKLSLHGGDSRQGVIGSYGGFSGRGGAIETKGDAWLLPNPKDGAATLIYGGYDTITVVKAAKRGILRRVLGGKTEEPASDGIRGDWKDQDIDSDVKRIMQFLEDAASKGQLFRRDPWSYDTRQASITAGILVTACHLYRAGHQDDANRITRRLFELAPEPILVIDQVVHELAERQYNSLVQSFFETKDWKAYLEGTRQLVTRFSRGWRNRDGAEVLSRHLETRVQGGKPALATLKGVSLKAEATNLLDDLLIQTEPIQVSPRPCWLLGSDLLPEEMEEEYGRRPSGEELSGQAWQSGICALGMEGFIALTAAATDDFLLPTSVTAGPMDYYYEDRMFRSYSGPGSGSSPGETQYATMTRPCSRGEIARAMILQTLPDQENELSSLNPEELQATAHQWWLKHHTESPSELSRHFLEFGDDQQQRMAVMALTKSDEEEDAKAVESHILAADDLANEIMTVELYLKARGAKARPFYEAYAKAVNERMGTGEAGFPGLDDDWEKQRADRVKAYLKKLSVYVHEVSPEKILADLRSGDLEPSEGLPMLEVAMEGGKLRQYLPDLVALAREQKDQAARMEFLMSIQSLADNDRDHFENGAELDAYQASLPALLLQSKEDWIYFLNQDEPQEDSDYLNGAPSFAAAAGWIMEQIYFPQHGESLQELSSIMGNDELWAFMKDQGRRSLAQGAEVKFPDSANVGEEQREAIRAKLKDLSPVEIIRYYDDLGLDEKLAWDEILSGFGETPPVGVVELRKRIAKIIWSNATDQDLPLQERIKTMTYAREVDQALIDELVGMMLAEATTFQDIHLAIQREGPEAHGLTLAVRRIESGQSWKQVVLTNAFDRLRDGRAEKVIGVYVPSRDSKPEAGLRFVPAQPADDNAHPLQAPISRFLSLLAEADQAYAVFVVETAANLKKQEAEEEDDEFP